MSGRLISFDKLPGVRPVGVWENWHRLFAKCIMKVMGYEATHACKDDQFYAGLNVVIDGAVHGVQSIWDDNSTKENGGFNLLTQRTPLMRLIESGCCGRFAIYGRLEIVLF